MRLRRIIPRFSLRTLVVFLLLVTSGVGLWWHWEPWYLERKSALPDRKVRSVRLAGLFVWSVWRDRRALSDIVAPRP